MDRSERPHDLLGQPSPDRDCSGIETRPAHVEWRGVGLGRGCGGQTLERLTANGQ